jgi:DnaJ-class molecular chaperone
MEDHLMTRIAALREKQKQAATCARCDGTGTVVEFVYVNGGRCYECRGTGIGSDGLVACGDG